MPLRLRLLQAPDFSALPLEARADYLEARLPRVAIRMAGDGGLLRGDAFRLLKKRMAGMHWDAYGLGPKGQAYHVMAQVQLRWWRWQVRWQATPISQDVLREVLADDPEQLIKVFGHVRHDRLYA